MKQLIGMAVFILCFGVGTAHAQHAGGGTAVAGGAGIGVSNSGGGGGGGSAAGGVTHHAVWVPPSNVSGKNDGPFLPTTYQNYQKAVEMGKAQVVSSQEPSVVEIAKMTQEQKASAAKSRFVVVQDAEGKIQGVKAQW